MRANKYSVLKSTGKYGPESYAFAQPVQRSSRLWFPMLLVLFALLLATSTMRAHGGQGYYQIRGEQMGDYTIHVWTAPGLMRTGEVHVDTAVFDAAGMPAFHTVILVRFIAMDSDMPPQTAIAGSPYNAYPFTRETRFVLDNPGDYRMEIMLSDESGMVGMAEVDVAVQTIAGSVKLVIVVLGLLSTACGVWLLFHARSFWAPKGKRFNAQHSGSPNYDNSSGTHQGIYTDIYPVAGQVGPITRLLLEREQGDDTGSIGMKSVWDLNPNSGGITPMADHLAPAVRSRPEASFTPTQRGWYERLNGPYHARALWIFMLIVVGHWLEHVLQIYQIYALGWAPAAAGGLIGLFFPVLITSETLHFVYDFIQWAGIVVLRGGFAGRARKFWLVAMVIQTWHFIEHVLLMGQYLTGYYIAGRVRQTSLLELFFPREELHFVYNLLVFVPMVVAVHYYMRLKIEPDPKSSPHTGKLDKLETRNLMKNRHDLHKLHEKPGRSPSRLKVQEQTPEDPENAVPFGADGARFLCNLLQHGVFLGIVVLLLMIIGYVGQR